MENTYTNILYVACNDTLLLKCFIIQVEKTFECYFTVDSDKNCYEIEFGSKGIDSIQKLKQLTREVTDNSLFIQIISYNLDKEEVAYHVYKMGKWIDKLEDEY